MRAKDQVIFVIAPFAMGDNLLVSFHETFSFPSETISQKVEIN